MFRHGLDGLPEQIPYTWQGGRAKVSKCVAVECVWPILLVKGPVHIVPPHKHIIPSGGVERKNRKGSVHIFNARKIPWPQLLGDLFISVEGVLNPCRSRLVELSFCMI